MTAFVGTVHPQFSLLGAPFSEDAVVDAAYSMIKEGKPYEKDIGDFIMDWVSDLPSITVQTSGTSGVPNSIKVEKKALVNSALATGKYFNLKAGDRCLLCLPAAYIAGKMMIIRALVLGLDLYIVQPSNRPLELTTKEFDFCAMVPLQVQNSLNQLSQIDKLIIGGSPLSTKLEKEISKTSCTAYETFGMAETLSHIAVRPVNLPHTDQKEALPRYFEAMPGVTFTTDKRSCLTIHAPHLQKSPIVTNDIVQLLNKRQFLWEGRADNVINSGGIKLYPEIIEKKLENLLNQRYFLTGMPDDDLGEKLVLCVEGNLNTAALKKKIKNAGMLEPFEVPKEIISFPLFEETSSGKVHRKASLELLNN